MGKTSVLQLAWKRREGGGGKTQRDYLDFVVDGLPLSEKVGGDLASCLGWFVPEENAKAVRRLLLSEPADLPDNRRSLYVCPECGELGCGAVTAVIESSGDKIIWRDFGFQSNSDGATPIRDYGDISFAFDRAQYKRALEGAAQPNNGMHPTTKY
jgi:hypothetical protein